MKEMISREKRLRTQIPWRCNFENHRDWFPIELCNWYGVIFDKVSGQDVWSKFWLHGNYLKSSFGKKSCLSKSFIKDIMKRIPRKIEIDSFYAIRYIFLKTIISNHKRLRSCATMICIEEMWWGIKTAS